ncbi:MAG TPA: pitrilysin family protein [Chloroflexota bacterium]|nr:pitrilysin family protein [Chloroflexota bacterium]
MSNPIQARTLGNGLMVITREVHDAPVATFWTWYRVGSRNETAGRTGISHWVEHMMFKGTPSLGKGEIFRSVNKNGGTLNGFTWIDYTAYFETLPSDRLDLALRIESDRMVNSLFDPQEVASERTVIISEREGGENFPTFHLDEEVTAAAFKAHPYGHPVIGWKCDLLAMTRDDLYEWYRTYYAPNNAVVVAVGDFDTPRLMERIEELFGPIPAGPPVPPVRTCEPEQEGERRVVVRRPGPTRYFTVVYHAPAANSPDVFPLLVLDAVLSGAKPMGLFAGRDTAMGRSARLYRLLVDTGLCTRAGSAFGLTRDPYLFEISASLRPTTSLEEVERRIFDEIDRIIREGVRPEEVEKAVKQVRAQFTYASEGVTNQAYWLGDLEMVCSYTLLETFVDRIAAVTAEDVQRVAETYLTPTNRTVGWFEPTVTVGAAEAPAGPLQAARRYWFYQAPARGASGVPTLAIQRTRLSNGMTIIGHARPETPAIVVRATIQAGAIYDPPGKEGLAHFTARMMQRGTSRHTFQQISELTDRVGASLSVDGTEHTIHISGRCLRDDLDLIIGLLGEIVREPIFPAAEMEKVRGEILTRLREQRDDTRSVSERCFRELAYPADHPYHRWAMGSDASVSSITRDDLASFHGRYVQPNRMSLAVAGGIDFDDFVDRMTRTFSGWNASGPSAPFTVPDAPLPDRLIRRDLVVPGKTQTDIALGQPSIRRKDPDFYALSMADLILGGLGLSGRLGENVRDRQGLAYYVYSDLEATIGPGPWEVRAGVNPVNVERAIESIIAEVERIRTQPVDEGELADAKSYLTGILPLSLETNAGVARVLETIEMYDLGLDYLDRYPGIINSLTREQILDAAARHFSTDRLVIVTAGPAR